MTLRDLPIGMYGAVMGLAGLGLTARAAASVFPGVVRAPAYFTEIWVLLGVLALLLLLPSYLLKVIRHPDKVREEFIDPAQLGFCGAVPVGMALVAGGLAPYLPALGGFLWWTAFGLLLALQVWALLRLFAGDIELGQLNAGWLIALVGGIVLPGPGLALGHPEASRFAFGFSATVAPMLMALLVYRAAIGAPLAPELRPTWFILLVPPSLVYANGMALYGEVPFLENLFYFSLVLAGALLVYARGFLAWSFASSWWAFTFPLDALAYAAVRHAQQNPAPLWKGFAAATLGLATCSVVLLIFMTLSTLRRKPG